MGEGQGARFATTAAGTALLSKAVTLGETDFGLNLSLYINSSDLVDGQETILLRTTGTPVELILSRAGTDYQLALRYTGTAGVQTTAPVTIQANSWQRADISYNIDSTLGAAAGLRFWVNKALAATIAPADLAAATPVTLVELGLVSAPAAVDLAIDNVGVGGICPGDDYQLIVRNAPGTRRTITGPVVLSAMDNVRIQGLRFSASSSIAIRNTQHVDFTACIVKTTATVKGGAFLRVIGNVFDGPGIVLEEVAGAQLNNNLFLNTLAGASGLAVTGGSMASDYNCYWPNAPEVAEPNSINADPNVSGDDYLQGAGSPLAGSGVDVIGFDADHLGRWIEQGNSSIGGPARYNETLSADSAGRITTRRIAGRKYTYTYDAMGRLVAYDHPGKTKDATYTYDHLGRRITMIVGEGTEDACKTRFAYDGLDVVAEYVDEGNDGTVDRKRIYWKLPQMDRMFGFVDIVGSTEKFYYYLHDHIGSVIGVVSESGTVVAEYDYDAFGVLHLENSFDRLDYPNRYRFQGREYDEHRGDYYFRMRVYVPEWGSFTGPDMDFNPTNPAGQGNYLFAENNPLIFMDPTGLAAFVDLNYYEVLLQERGIGVDEDFVGLKLALPHLKAKDFSADVKTYMDAQIRVHGGHYDMEGKFAIEAIYKRAVRYALSQQKTVVRRPGKSRFSEAELEEAYDDKFWERVFEAGTASTKGRDRNNALGAGADAGYFVLNELAWEVMMLPGGKVVEMGVDLAGDAWSLYRLRRLSKLAKKGKLSKRAEAVLAARKATNRADALDILKKGGIGEEWAGELIEKGFICFVAGTKIVTEGGLKSIEEIEVGDKVLSRNEEGDTGYKTVMKLYKTHPRELLHLRYRVDGDSEEAELVGTAGHPFWSVTQKKWVEMGELVAGEALLLADGSKARVLSVRRESALSSQLFTTYNFSVEDWHTYFVAPPRATTSEGAVWVHNAGSKPCFNAWNEFQSKYKGVFKNSTEAAEAWRLLNAGDALDKGRLTKAGRALQKHGARGGLFPNMGTSSARVLNPEGRKILEEILTDPGRVVRHKPRKVHGVVETVIDIRDSRGRGVRFSLAGDMIGFLD